MNEYRYCGFWRRLGALFIDSMLFTFILNFTIYFIIGFFEDYLAPIKGQGIVSTEFTYFLDKVLIIFSLLATSLFNSSKMQGTPGKYFFKVKIITSDGKKIGLLRALVRILISSFIAVATVFLSPTISILLYIQIIINIMSSLLLIFTKQKAALHDLLCKTRVVACDSKGNIIKFESTKVLEGR